MVEFESIVKHNEIEFHDKNNALDSTSNNTLFTAVVLAGSRSNGDPLTSLFNEQYKALIPVCGKPMVSRVITALLHSKSIGKIVILFDCSETLYNSCPDLQNLAGNEKISIAPCQNSICDSVVKGLETAGGHWPCLVTTADHALLTPAIIDEFCQNAYGKSDMAVGLVEKTTLDKDHPGSTRTYLPFRGSKLSGANLFAFLTPNSQNVLAFWKSVEQQRKKPWKLFCAFGLRNVLGLLLKRYTVDEAFVRASTVLGVAVRAIRLPFAEAAIDVDSPKDHAQVTRIIETRDALS